MASFETQFNNLCKSWKLKTKDVKLKTHLSSFHGISSAIYKRNDTKQYIYIETAVSNRDGVDDYFKWHYIPVNKKFKKWLARYIKDSITDNKYETVYSNRYEVDKYFKFHYI
jgi:hypothetical protein